MRPVAQHDAAQGWRLHSCMHCVSVMNLVKLQIALQAKLKLGSIDM